MAKPEEKPTMRSRFAKFRERVSQLVQVFTMTRKQDKLLIPWMVGVGLIPIALAVVACLIFGLWASIMPVGVMLGLLAAMLIFTRRSTKAMYGSIAGQPGAAAAVLNSLRGDWRVTPAVQVNTSQDCVHRVIGKPGVVLVAEGSPERLKRMISQEMKRISRVTGGVEIYRVIVGENDEQVKLDKLQRHLVKLPRNLTGKQIAALDKRMVAISGPNIPIPKGPMPKGARMPKGAQMPRGSGKR